MNELQIIKEVQSGDTSHYEELEKKYHPLLWGIIHNLGLFYDKDEVFQVARIKFYECCLNFDAERNIKLITYVRKSVYSQLLNYIRDTHQPDTVEPDFDKISVNTDNKFNYLVSDLSIDEQRILRSYFVYGNTMEEIAKFEDCSRTWIRARINKALEKLRRFYN